MMYKKRIKTKGFVVSRTTKLQKKMLIHIWINYLCMPVLILEKKVVCGWDYVMILVKNLLTGNECVRVRKELLYDGNYVV